MDQELKHFTYLFPTFLADKKVYNLAQAWWRRLFTGLAAEAGLTFRSYLNPRDSRGAKEYDANPLFDAYFPQLRKAVRVIQEEPEPNAPDLTAWIDTIALEEEQPPVPELVIALALSRESGAQARSLIRRWVVEDVSKEEMAQMPAVESNRPPG